MTPAWLLRHAIDPALSLLPEKMGDPRCRPLLLAIALQESRLNHRRQIGGPALGLWQWEGPESGVVKAIDGILKREDTGGPLRAVLAELSYPKWHWSPELCYKALEHNDILAAAFSRCLLWTLPRPLPGPGDIEEAWRQYIAAWRPGLPRRDTWDVCYLTAWAHVATRAQLNDGLPAA